MPLYPLRTLGNDGRLPGPVAAAFASGRATAIAPASVAATTQSKDGIAVGVETPARAKSVYRRCLCSSHSLATIPHRDDRTDDGAFGAMMLLASGKGPKNHDF